jgi:hypothetical protein
VPRSQAPQAPRGRSDALHARVRAFADACLAGLAGRPGGRGEDTAGAFDALACDIACFQAETSPPIARLFGARRLDPASLRAAAEIPAVPSDAFKLTRVASHAPEDDAIVFRTSGTTVGARGEHALRTTETYEHLSLAFGARMLLPDGAPVSAIVLAPPPAEAGDSSLGFMCRLFGERWGGGGRFLMPGGRLDVAGLLGAIAEARAGARPVLLLATSFALVHLLDEIGEVGERVGGHGHGRGGPGALVLPAGSRVMQTGGYKGRSREVSAAELRASVSRLLGLDERAIVSEYGMTELSSQAYEGTLRAMQGLGEGRAGLLEAPPWMRVTAVDPTTLSAVRPGDEGIARIVDLGNVDGAVAVQTQDRVRAVPGGFELLGRLPGATPRGCSLAIDELLERHGRG